MNLGGYLMSENNIPETTLEKWEVQELVDDAIASGHHSEFLRNEFIYEFKQGGRVIRGLTASMYAHLALGARITIDDIEMVVENDDNTYYVRYTATASTEIDGTRITAHGTACEPLHMSGRFDKFAYQKSMTKACRNARKQLLPYDLVLKAIEELANLPSRTAVPAARAPQPPTEMEKAFSFYEKHKDDLPSNFWDKVKDEFGKTSREAMEDSDWEQFPAFISKILTETENTPTTPAF